MKDLLLLPIFTTQDLSTIRDAVEAHVDHWRKQVSWSRAMLHRQVTPEREAALTENMKRQQSAELAKAFWIELEDTLRTLAAQRQLETQQSDSQQGGLDLL